MSALMTIFQYISIQIFLDRWLFSHFDAYCIMQLTPQTKNFWSKIDFRPQCLPQCLSQPVDSVLAAIDVSGPAWGPRNIQYLQLISRSNFDSKNFCEYTPFRKRTLWTHPLTGWELHLIIHTIFKQPPMFSCENNWILPFLRDILLFKYLHQAVQHQLLKSTFWTHFFKQRIQ